MLRWGFWKQPEQAENAGAGPGFGAAEMSDEWSFLRAQPDHDADEMASVRTRGRSAAADAGDRYGAGLAHCGAGGGTAVLPAPAEAKLVLETSFDGIRTLHTLTGPAILGRRDRTTGLAPDIDFDPDDAVSRRHARVWPHGHGWLLEDLDSTNGTRHNGRELRPGEEVPLGQGDVIELGESRVTVRSNGAEPLSEEDRRLVEMLELVGVGVPAVRPEPGGPELSEPPAEPSPVRDAAPAFDLLDLALEGTESEPADQGPRRSDRRVVLKRDSTRALVTRARRTR